MKTILISIPDLMFETRVAGVVRQLRHRVETFSAEKISSANLVIVCLENNRSWSSVVESARKQNVPILAFGRHTSAELLRGARDAGATRVVVNSDIAENFPQILQEMLNLPVAGA